MDEFEREERDFFFAYNMILDLPIDEHAKIVYMCLCRFSDGNKKSFSSYASIGKKCSIKSRTTIKKAIDKLMEVGLLDYKTRKTSKGGQTSNLYFIYNRPNEEVQKKYTKAKFSKDKEKLNSCSKDGHPPVQQMDTPLSSRWTPPVQQVDTPCPADGHPLSSRWTPPVQQMDTPCPADGHEVYPSKYIHLKNTQSINQDGQTDAQTQNLFETIGVNQLKHTSSIPLVKAALSDLLQTRRVGKNIYPEAEMAAALKALTYEKIDFVLERYTGQAQKRKIPSPFEYIKTCIFNAGKEKFNSTPEVLPDKPEKAPTYDMDEYIRLSMERLMDNVNGDDA